MKHVSKVKYSNKKIEDQIVAAVASEPLLSGTEIIAVVTDSSVVLSGMVGHLRKKCLAEKIATRIAPSKYLDQRIVVVLEKHRCDETIFGQIVKRLQVNLGFSADKIKIAVKDGYVELQGEIPWSYQKDLAFDSISDLDGIREITNNITVSPDTQGKLMRKQIRQVLSMVSSNKIDIKLDGTTITLAGAVTNEEEKNAITTVVAKIIGIGTIRNQLRVRGK